MFRLNICWWLFTASQPNKSSVQQPDRFRVAAEIFLAKSMLCIWSHFCSKFSVCVLVDGRCKFHSADMDGYDFGAEAGAAIF